MLGFQKVFLTLHTKFFVNIKKEKEIEGTTKILKIKSIKTEEKI